MKQYLFFILYILHSITGHAQENRPLLGEVAIKYQDRKYVLNGEHSEQVINEFKRQIFNNIQKPNKQFLGIELQLIIYQFADQDSNKSVESWFTDSTWYNKVFTFWFDSRGRQLMKDRYLWLNETLMKLGEKSVYFSRSSFQQAKRRLELVFEKYGYFDIEVLPSFRVVGDRVNVEFYAYHKQLYHIDSVSFSTDSKAIATHLKPIKDSLTSLLFGQDSIYTESKLLNITNIIVNRFRNEGFYDFYNNNISLILDTLDRTNKVHIDINIPVNDSKIDKRFSLRYVNVYPDYNINRYPKNVDTKITADQTYFKPEQPGIFLPHLREAIRLKKGSTYAVKDQDITYQNLFKSGLYSKIDIRYTKVDSISKLDVGIFLPSTPKYGVSWINDVSLSNTFFRYNTGVNFSVNNLLGINDKTSYNINYSIMRFDQKEAQSIQAQDFNFGVTTQLPYSISGLLNEHELSPQTKLSLRAGRTFQSGVQQGVIDLTFEEQYDNPDNSKFNIKYIELAFSSNLNYNESLKRALDLYYPRLRDSLYIPSISGNITYYTLNRDKHTKWSSQFVENSTIGFLLVEQQRLERILQENFIASSSFSYTGGNRQEGSFFRLTLESAGHWVAPFESLLDYKAGDLTESGQYSLFAVPYAQYLKLDIDYRYYYPFTLRSTLATRVFIGLANAYGNSDDVPFRKQYFSGGSNDNRAWNSLSLGPGRQPVFNTNSLSLRSGDLKLFWSLEYRFGIYGNLLGAVFTDVSNIWMLNKNASSDEQFDWDDFYEELAIGSGLGLRYDFNWIVIRGDFGWKVYDPSKLNIGSPWVIKNQKLFDFTFNFGIGYPF